MQVNGINFCNRNQIGFKGIYGLNINGKKRNLDKPDSNIEIREDKIVIYPGDNQEPETITPKGDKFFKLSINKINGNSKIDVYEGFCYLFGASLPVEIKEASGNSCIKTHGEGPHKHEDPVVQIETLKENATISVDDGGQISVENAKGGKINATDTTAISTDKPVNLKSGSFTIYQPHTYDPFAGCP